MKNILITINGLLIASMFASSANLSAMKSGNSSHAARQTQSQEQYAMFYEDMHHGLMRKAEKDMKAFDCYEREAELYGDTNLIAPRSLENIPNFTKFCYNYFLPMLCKSIDLYHCISNGTVEEYLSTNLLRTFCSAADAYTKIAIHCGFEELTPNFTHLIKLVDESPKAKKTFVSFCVTYANIVTNRNESRFNLLFNDFLSKPDAAEAIDYFRHSANNFSEICPQGFFDDALECILRNPMAYFALTVIKEVYGDQPIVNTFDPRMLSMLSNLFNGSAGLNLHNDDRIKFMKAVKPSLLCILEYSRYDCDNDSCFRNIKNFMQVALQHGDVLKAMGDLFLQSPEQGESLIQSIFSQILQMSIISQMSQIPQESQISQVLQMSQIAQESRIPGLPRILSMSLFPHITQYSLRTIAYFSEHLSVHKYVVKIFNIMSSVLKNFSDPTLWLDVVQSAKATDLIVGIDVSSSSLETKYIKWHQTPFIEFIKALRCFDIDMKSFLHSVVDKLAKTLDVFFEHQQIQIKSISLALKIVRDVCNVGEDFVAYLSFYYTPEIVAKALEEHSPTNKTSLMKVLLLSEDERRAMAVDFPIIHQSRELTDQENFASLMKVLLLYDAPSSAMSFVLRDLCDYRKNRINQVGFSLLCKLLAEKKSKYQDAVESKNAEQMIRSVGVVEGFLGLMTNEDYNVSYNPDTFSQVSHPITARLICELLRLTNMPFVVQLHVENKVFTSNIWLQIDYCFHSDGF